MILNKLKASKRWKDASSFHVQRSCQNKENQNQHRFLPLMNIMTHINQIKLKIFHDTVVNVPKNGTLTAKTAENAFIVPQTGTLKAFRLAQRRLSGKKTPQLWGIG